MQSHTPNILATWDQYLLIFTSILMPFIYLQFKESAAFERALQRQRQQTCKREGGGNQGKASQDQYIRVRNLDSVLQVSFSDGLEAGIIGLHLERHLDKGADNISRARWESLQPASYSEGHGYGNGGTGTKDLPGSRRMKMEAYVSFASPLRDHCPLKIVAKEKESQLCAYRDRQYVTCLELNLEMGSD